MSTLPKGELKYEGRHIHFTRGLASLVQRTTSVRSTEFVLIMEKIKKIEKVVKERPRLFFGGFRNLQAVPDHLREIIYHVMLG